MRSRKVGPTLGFASKKKSFAFVSNDGAAKATV